MKTLTLGGKEYNYNDNTEFLVQVGKDSGSYKTKYSFSGNLDQAVHYYKCINIGNGYKKRLLCKEWNNKTLVKHFS